MKTGTFWFKFRTVTLIDSAYTGVLLAVSIAYFIYPPIVTIGFIFVCFAISLLVGRSREGVDA